MGKNIAIYQRSFLIYDISYARDRRKIDSLCCQMLNVKLHVCTKIFMSTLWGFLIKMHKHMREVPLKTMEGKKSKILFINLLFIFHSKKDYRDENRFLWKINIGRCLHLFSILKPLWIPCTIFQLVIQVLSWMLQCKIPVDFIFLAKSWYLISYRSCFKRKICMSIWMKIVLTLMYLWISSN